MAYTEIDNSTDFFRTKLYTGNGADGQAITYDESENMTPNFVWIKERNSTSAHKLIDSVRGANKAMSIDQTEAERTHQYLADFNDANGFTIGTTDGGTNQNNNTFVSWNWKEIAGVFDIVGFTGNGSGRTISHSLGSVPKFMIVKDRNNVKNWGTYHVIIGAGKNAGYLNNTVVPEANANFWNNTTPTASVFSVGSDNTYNGNGIPYIIYLFGNKQGVSKMGNYVGNGNVNGTFVYLGFKPAFLMIKCTNAARSWQIHNSKSSPFNTGNTNARLFANLVDAEATNSSLDLLSNGFKTREGDDLNTNGGGNTYMYIAFAENPFATSTGIPATAR